MIVNHQTGECSLPDCFCHEAQRLEPSSSTPDFTREWDTAPRGMTNYVEQDVAEFWYRRGMLAGKDAATVLQSEDLKEMARVARERVGR